MRNETGIGSLIDRLRRTYKEHGRLIGRKPRGWTQQQASRALRGEAPDDEQSGEEDEDMDDEDDGDFDDDEDVDEDAETASDE